MPETGFPPRYSIPFFVSPAPSQLVSTLPRFITPENPKKYDELTFQEYSDMTSKYQYEESEA
jgi:isopenicillin N synthase-like dioxygenase